MDDILILDNVAKEFSEQEVLRGISMSVKKGEFLTLLGPSGCGKTTTLRIIAGLERPDIGRIFLEGADVTNTEPNLRNVNTVFQNYALFPHMNVFDNVAYPLKIRGINKKKIKPSVLEALLLVKMDGYEKRRIMQLSGGEKQRVAIARALMNKPRILLLDEPLGALDLKLRQYMQLELKRLQKQLGQTFIYVTHDQEEALNMSDRIAVMNEGLLEQMGTPYEIYNRPATRFVARFVGDRNIFEATVKNSLAVLDVLHTGVPCECEGLKDGDRISIAVHSDKIRMAAAGLDESDKPYGLRGVVDEIYYTGSQIKYIIKMSGREEVFITAVTYDGESRYNEGDAVLLHWEIKDGVVIK